MNSQTIGSVLTTKRIGVLALIALVVGAFAVGGFPLGALDSSDDSLGAVAAEEEQPRTVVSLVAADDAVHAGDTTTYDVVVENATGGVGAYAFAVTANDSAVATIDDVSLAGEPSQKQASMSTSNGGSTATVSAAGADTDDSGNVVVATVTVRGDGVGTTDLTLDVETLDTEAGQNYTVTDVLGTSIRVVEAEPVDQPLTAAAGDDLTVDEGANVTLDASASSGADGDLRYSWNQTAGPNVTLDSTNNSTASFVAPNVGERTTLVFDVTVSDDDETDTDTVEVHVRDTDDDDERETLATSVTMNPATDEIDEGDETTFDVVVTNASGGVGAYNVTVTVTDSDVAVVTGVELSGTTENSTSTVEIADDESSVRFVATGVDTDQNGSVVLATVTVEGDDDGETDLTLAVESLENEQGQSYTVTNATGSSLTVERDGRRTSSNDDSTEYTVDDIAQMKYGQNFAELDTETAGQVQAIANRQPLPAGVTPGDIETREEIANRLYGTDYDESELADELTREQLLEVQNSYDAQFGPLPTNPAYTLDDITGEKYWDYTFDEVSAETAGHVLAIYNRQPYTDDVAREDLVHIKTRTELAFRLYKLDLDESELASELTREQYLAVQNAYDAQFSNEQ
ncbi:hypothetical protein SAMN04487950_0937 [Halogranum rubrum]|uniref:Uncharacterized protein n=1 Tax=Halogranum rubrum TaxID=553466 RepID=A0A1I4C3H6_9EURY|nr:hypothetical protein [Halogranum rubrum]SFK75654.1 hypothetical protein SAMN04487950_0937 [Halogranum rubrum]